MCDETTAPIHDSARLRGLKKILSQKVIDRAIGEQLQTRSCKRIGNRLLIWLIVGMGLFAGKSYRQIFRLCASAAILAPFRATLTTARKRLSANLIEQLSLGASSSSWPSRPPSTPSRTTKVCG